MDQDTVLSACALAISIGGSILAVINHKRIRSNCCGKPLVVSVDVENTTPPKADDLKITISPSEK